MFLPGDFFKKYGAALVEATQGTPLFPSIKAAQAALETGYGKSTIGNNLFGIKAAGAHSPYWQGKAQAAKTTEVLNGKAGTYNLEFRAYNSTADSIKDHSYFLLQNPRYKKAGVFTATTPEQQARALQAAGYATDPAYDIITKYGLKSLDKKKSSSMQIEIAIAAVLLAIAGYFLYKNFR
ncbi:MAG: glucosaminidase domain-containing protein [Bacteroidetes bacterium]|nr:glucosaminidase domain-containing protein [Bacteroidota bacterium]